VLDVLVEAVLLSQHPLHGDELGLGVADERDEEQPRVEVSDTVGAVGEVVSAPQHSHAVHRP